MAYYILLLGLVVVLATMGWMTARAGDAVPDPKASRALVAQAKETRAKAEATRDVCIAVVKRTNAELREDTP